MDGKFLCGFQQNDYVLPVKGRVTYCEPQHDISNNVVCATSKASDQPGHARRLIRGFAGHLNIL